MNAGPPVVLNIRTRSALKRRKALLVTFIINWRRVFHRYLAYSVAIMAELAGLLVFISHNAWLCVVSFS